MCSLYNMRKTLTPGSFVIIPYHVCVCVRARVCA